MKKSILGILGILGAAALALSLVAATPSQSAHAWAWSSSATIHGQVNTCYGNAAHVVGVLNGQYQSSQTGWGYPPSYALTFSNVPSGGGWAWVMAYCSNYGGPRGTWVHVYRPAVGTTDSSANI